jgi:hypothetical protein
MWVGSRFWGDNDAVLMDVQHQLYPVIIGLLYGEPRKCYLDASRLVQADTELAKRLLAEESFDHRTLQSSHDFIAAWFRFRRGSQGGRTLFEAVDDYRDRLGREWRVFYEKEILTLCEDDDFVRAVVTAAAFPNPDGAGRAAEEQLDEILAKRYAAMGSRAYIEKALNKLGAKNVEADK